MEELGSSEMLINFWQPTPLLFPLVVYRG